MKPETLEALKGSIVKWERIVAGTARDEGSSNCPLCARFLTHRLSCKQDDGERCPVAVMSGHDGCRGTPYDAYMRDATVEAAQEELDFLRSLLPVEVVQVFSMKADGLPEITLRLKDGVPLSLDSEEIVDAKPGSAFLRQKIHKHYDIKPRSSQPFVDMKGDDDIVDPMRPAQPSPGMSAPVREKVVSVLQQQRKELEAVNFGLRYTIGCQRQEIEKLEKASDDLKHARQRIAEMGAANERLLAQVDGQHKELEARRHDLRQALKRAEEAYSFVDLNNKGVIYGGGGGGGNSDPKKGG